MNDLTVIQASQGLCLHLMEEHKGNNFSVVVGYDARHNSRRYALRTATSFLLKGVRVYLFGDICCTPFVPFAVTKLGCAAGVMVTASHNPKEDNGYKVYGANGAQIISPTDKHISDTILANLEPWEGAWSADLVKGPLCSDELAQVGDAYFASIVSSRRGGPRTGVKFAYTAMHGVGHRFALRSFAAFGLEPFVPVPEQIEPDPEFPTVAYPNPEEGAGALTLSMRTADATGCTVILANDPDADRLAVAAKHDGAWRIFTGNEIGSLFAWWAWRCYREANPTADPANVYMLGSAVSTKMVASIAAVEGFKYEETLTGFKWMGNRSRALQAEGKKVIFSFEEAIGFCFGSTVVDKDGISGAAVMAELALFVASEGHTLVDQLNAIYEKYGFHANNNSYFICRSPPTIDKIFADIRKEYPRTVAGHAVTGVRDVTTGYDSSTPNHVSALPVQSGHMITFTLDNGAAITLRTSGTEPKIKYYTDLRVKASSEAEREAGRVLLASIVAAATTQLLRPDEFGLQRKA